MATYTLNTSDSGACNNDPVTIQGLDDLVVTTTQDYMVGFDPAECMVGSDLSLSSDPGCFTIEGDGVIIGNVVVEGSLTVAGSIVVTSSDGMYLNTSDTTWVHTSDISADINWGDSEGGDPGLPETGFGIQVPRIVLTAETELELEALRTLVYDAREKGHEKAEEWAAALDQFKAFRQDNY